MSKPDSSDGGPAIQVVAPGSAGDPFSANAGAPVEPVPTESLTPGSEPASDDGSDDLQVFAESFNKAVEEKVNTLMPELQKGWDRRNSALTNQVKKLREEVETAQQEAKRAQRDVKAAELTEDERKVLESKWALEDAEEALQKKKGAVDEYFRSTVTLDLLRQYGQFGLTEEALEGVESVDEMEALALKTQVQFLQSGGKLPAKGGRPAAASAPSDVGGGPAAAEPFKLSTEQGHEALAANVKGLFSQKGQIR